MPIQHNRGGSTSITGDSIHFYRVCQMKMCVGLECKGIRINRGRVIWKQAKKEFGIIGGKQTVYAWLCMEVERLRKLQEHQTEDGRRLVDGEEVQ